MNGRAAISGIGTSMPGRRTERPAIRHLLDAVAEALADAGLDRSELDGIVTYPGRVEGAGGLSPLGTGEVRAALGLRTEWHAALPEGPAQTAALMQAAMAVATGQCRHVLVFRALTESTSQAAGRQAIGAGGPATVGGWISWLLPMDAVSPANWAAMFARRCMYEHGLTRAQLGAQAVAQRRHAALNPRAVMREVPLTLDDYLAARMISDPLCLFDCDVPVDGAVAIIVSATEAARGLRKPPILIEAMGAALYGPDSWDQRPDLTTMAAHDAAGSLWQRTRLSARDVDVAGLYDGFSIFVPMWLEAFGFCAAGASGAFMAEGRTALGGDLPVNTGGGQLSAGRLHGYGLLHEVCLQLRGEAAGRQVPNARVGVVGMGGGPLAGAVLLRRPD